MYTLGYGHRYRYTESTFCTNITAYVFVNSFNLKMAISDETCS